MIFTNARPAILQLIEKIKSIEKQLLNHKKGKDREMSRMSGNQNSRPGKRRRTSSLSTDLTTQGSDLQSSSNSIPNGSIAIHDEDDENQQYIPSSDAEEQAIGGEEYVMRMSATIWSMLHY